MLGNVAYGVGGCWVDGHLLGGLSSVVVQAPGKSRATLVSRVRAQRVEHGSLHAFFPFAGELRQA